MYKKDDTGEVFMMGFILGLLAMGVLGSLLGLGG